MSKGNDTFYYGDKDLPTKYDKKDIECVTTIKTNGKSVVGDFAIIKIDFKDGSCIKIPNIFVDYLQLNNKLFEYPRTEINKFPYLRT